MANARSKHEEVSKSVADLRSRVSDQQEKVKNLNMDFIAAESDLSALRSEKDELEQALLRDKEEIRGLQKRMKEVDDEKATLKTLLEKLKKEARQQKGMVTIAKKQLSTSENNRDLAQKDLDDHHKTAFEEDEDEDKGMGAGTAAGLGLAGGAALGAGAGTAASFFSGGGDTDGRSASPFGQASSPSFRSNDDAADVPLPATPKALSPVATGASSRSNNPFDRLRTQSRGPAPPVPQAQSPSESTLEVERSASSPDEATREQAASPSSFGTSALVGATTAVGLAAGVAVAGASAVFDAAKEAVTGESHEDKDASSKEIEDGDQTPKGEENDDPFGADSGHFGSATTAADTDAFGVAAPASTAVPASEPTGADTDPFGAPTGRGFDSADSGFGDSFNASTGPSEPSTAVGATGSADFDSAFADFDDAPKTAEPTSLAPGTFGKDGASSPGIPMGVPKSALPNLRPEAERSDSTQAIAPASEVATPGDITPVDTQSATDLEEPAAPVTRSEGDVSSDEEDDGPEDLERPMRPYGSSTRLPEAANEPEAEVVPAPAASIAPVPVAVQTSGPTDTAQKGRRSAPPPPASRGSSVPPLAAPITSTSNDDFDPFGAPATSSQQPTRSADDDFDPFGAPSTSSPTQAQSSSNVFGSLPPGAAAPTRTADATGPQTSKFDDDDFDFSDMPPAQVDTSEQVTQQPTSAAKVNNTTFDDEFSGFDDEFESVPTNPNSGSDRSNISKSFEMVTPNQEGSQQAQQASGGNMDEWGMAGSAASAPSQAQRPQPTSGFSFDDAFGGDFEPA